MLSRDNPASDVRGANAAGGPWRSMLVRTGVFHGSGNDKGVPPPAPDSCHAADVHHAAPVRIKRWWLCAPATTKACPRLRPTLATPQMCIMLPQSGSNAGGCVACTQHTARQQEGF